MKLNIKKNAFIILLTIFLGITIVLRCKPSLFYQKAIIEYGILILLTFASLLIYISKKGNKKFFILELLALIMPIFFLENTIDKYSVIVLIGIVYFFIIQDSTKDFYYIKYPLLLFAIITSIVSWIAFFNPNFYISKILTIFSESSDLAYSFLYRGMNHGFTNHYSRNAFYISVGIMITFSEMLIKKNNNKINCILFIFFSFTMLLVAKRGTTLFLITTLFIVLLLKEKNLSTKISKSVKNLIIILFLLIFAYFFVPGTSNLFNRIVEMANSDDVSTGRFYLYEIAFEMFKNNPILGNGWGSFLRRMTGTTFQAVHNDYLQLLAETGIIGFLIFVSFNLFTIHYTSKIYKRIFIVEEKNKNTKDMLIDKMIITFSLSYQIFFVLYSLTGFPHFSYEQALLYFMASGVGVGMYKYYFAKEK